MLAPKQAVIAFAAMLAVSSSLTLLQTARPALADADDHRYNHQQRYDRDDRHHHHNTYVNHGGWNYAGHYNNGRRWANNTTYWTRNTNNAYWTRNANTGTWNTNHWRHVDADDRHHHHPHHDRDRDRDHDRR